MSSEIVTPPLGMSSSDDSQDDLSSPEGAAAASKPNRIAASSAAIPGEAGSASADDLGMALNQASPDPFLEEFQPPPPEATVPHESPAARVKPGDELAHDEPPVTELPKEVLIPAELTGEEKSGSTSESFLAIDLNAPPPSKTVAEPSKSEGSEDDDDDEDEDLPPRGPTWPMALLASYASAVTIGLIWVLWGQRAPRESVEADPFPAADSAPDPGRRAGESHKIAPPPPIPADRIATLGQTIRVGSLEVTPLEITTGPVTLGREVTQVQTRPGGADALFLKVRLKNVSSDSFLFPLDEAFLRERGRGIQDSFIETGPGPAQRIEMFPLAVASEWSIVGQEFRGLQPSESYETRVVTAPDANTRLAPEMTWRLRLRTDINQSETLGIRFREDEIRKRPGGDSKQP